VKYHIALSFSGKDRDYVERVATLLRAAGVDVFYDFFEEENLWGKDLYEHLSSVYKDQAMFTVMFVSESYKNKLWGNHERKSAQARAFSESREYILPAKFDVDVDIPGVLDTTGYIDLNKKSPEELSELIVKKLKKSGVDLEGQFEYSDFSKQDIDYPINEGTLSSKIIKKLKSYNWYTQSPAVEQILDLDWGNIDSNQAFVLGRNLYQCACGGERRAESILSNLRRELASIPKDSTLDLVNGMLFEVYFNSKGEFRGAEIKGRCLDNLLSLQGIKKFESSILFIRRALEPYKSELPFLPNTSPEKVTFNVKIKKSDPPEIKSIKCNGIELLSKDGDPKGKIWRLSFRKFSIKGLKGELSREWYIPLEQLSIDLNKKVKKGTEFRLPKETSIIWPTR
jgi:hypothetical protein